MPNTWVLIADRSHARIVASRGPSAPLERVEEIQHPEGTLQDHEMKTDEPGRVFDRAGHARHSTERRESPHDHETATFARALAAKLREARNEHRFDRLVLAAEPRFLGVLRDTLDPQTLALVVAEVPKHLLGAGDGDLAEHLADALRA